MNIKIYSGGQTGVDRAALDVAIKFNLPYCGWCPKKRKAEDGPISSSYSFLIETNSYDYPERTKLNVKESDGTIIFLLRSLDSIKDGTNLTIHEAKITDKPFLIIDLLKEKSGKKILDWVIKNKINLLNIAGPRESQSPGIYKSTYHFLENFLFPLFLQKHECLENKLSPLSRL